MRSESAMPIPMFISLQSEQAHSSASNFTERLLAVLNSWVTPAAVFIIIILIGYIIQAIVVKKLEAFFAKTTTDLDDLFLAAIRRHLPIWSILAGIVISLRFAPIDAEHHFLAERFAIVGFWISLTFAVANLASAMLARLGSRSDSGITGASLTRNILRGIIVTFGALLILQNLGIQITPLLAALGVGSLAIALGLQPTLADLFAGIHITLTRHVRVGDTVLLENGSQGKVLDISWRAVRILDGNNNLVAIPNGRFANMIVTNTQFPETTVFITIDTAVAHRSDLDQVERIAVEVGVDVMKTIPGGVPEFKPSVLFHKFADCSIHFKLALRAQKFADQGLVIHETLKRLKLRFESAGIESPPPPGSVRIVK
ncbi:MAG: mechanosensitive ion channel family protein [Planctomycetota bacterium]